MKDIPGLYKGSSRLTYVVAGRSDCSQNEDVYQGTHHNDLSHNIGAHHFRTIPI